MGSQQPLLPPCRTPGNPPLLPHGGGQFSLSLSPHLEKETEILTSATKGTRHSRCPVHPAAQTGVQASRRWEDGESDQGKEQEGCLARVPDPFGALKVTTPGCGEQVGWEEADCGPGTGVLSFISALIRLLSL